MLREEKKHAINTKEPAHKSFVWFHAVPLFDQNTNTFYNFCRPTTVGDGSHNVSRWMTWLPISLKNAAKCDKWYQLQNHSITESLNANGAREKPLTAIPVHAVSLSVEQKPNSTKEPWLVSPRKSAGAVEWLPRIRRQTVDSWVIQLKLFCRSASCGKSTSGNTSLVKNTKISFVTDLSAAGSPAELKHITQRRKRKQP